ncbi:N-6 DNA methylase, partial [Streptococcus pneumoniae]|uniref:N-6 DNA methylase n=1 Tax=Streptococcus pneumoniae TaxID=1313 RepID=UPI0019D71042
DDVVSCVIAMPPNLFRSVAIPVCVWFFTKDKKAGPRGSVDRSGEVLCGAGSPRRASTKTCPGSASPRPCRRSRRRAGP